MKNREKTLDIIYLCLNSARAYGMEIEVVLEAMLNMLGNDPASQREPEIAMKRAMRLKGLLIPSGVLDTRRSRMVHSHNDEPKLISFDPASIDSPSSIYGDATVASFQGTNKNYLDTYMNTDPKEKEEVIVPPASEEAQSPAEPIHKEAGKEIIWPTIPVGGKDNVEPHKDTDVSRG